MTNLTVKGKYSTDKNKTQTTLGLWVDDVKVKVTANDQTVRAANSRNLDGLEIGIEKPGHFMIDHEVQKQVTRFQFHSKAIIASKPVKFTLNHAHGREYTILEGALNFDSKNKLVVKHDLHKKKPTVKYEYTLKDHTVVEPSFDFVNDSWNLSLKHNFRKKDHVKVSYQSFMKKAEIEFVKSAPEGGPWKLVAHVPFSKGKPPMLTLEKEWAINF